MNKLRGRLFTRPRWIIILVLTILLPAVVFVLLLVRGFQSEEFRRAFQEKEKQQQITRLLENHLSQWLLTIRSSSDAASALFYRFEEEGLFFSDWNIFFARSEGPGSNRRFSAEGLSEWHRISSRPGNREARLRQLLTAKPQLAPLARLGLLQAALRSRSEATAVNWMAEILASDREALAENGAPVIIAAALSAATGSEQPTAVTTALPEHRALCGEAAAGLLQGTWKLPASRWLLYAREISSLLEENAENSPVPVVQLKQRERIVVSLLEIQPSILDLYRKERPRLDRPALFELADPESILVCLPGEEKIGFLIPLQTFVLAAQDQLDQLTAFEHFTGSVGLSSDPRGDRLLTLPSVSVQYFERDAGSLVHLQRYSFYYLTGLLLLIITSGLLFSYRTVSREMEVSRMKSDFVSAVSHEFRSPLSAIQALASRLESGKVQEEAMRMRYLHGIRQESHRLARMVNALLDFSRLQEGRRKLQLEQFDLVAAAQEVAEAFELHGQRQRIRILQSGSDCSVVADHVAVSQCIYNLIDNALKYSPQDSPVTVTAHRNQNQTVLLQVADQGPGIPPAEQEKIFEEFYRSDRSEYASGVGLGLALVRKIMAEHGGEVTVESQVGAGSCFRLIFPAAADSESKSHPGEPEK